MTEYYTNSYPDYYTQMEQQTIAVGKTYVDIVINPDVTDVSLPNDFDQPIRPGTFGPNVKALFTGHAFTHKLEPGVIHDSITHLVLGESYRHPIKSESIPSTVENLYIFDTNRDLAPTDRPFYLYRKYVTGRCFFTPQEEQKWAIGLPSYYIISTGAHIWTYLITLKYAFSKDKLQQTEIDQTKNELTELNADVASTKKELARLKAKVETTKADLVALEQSKQQIRDSITELRYSVHGFSS